MNALLGACGYPWTVVPVEMRAQYMAALEDASVMPFVDVLGGLVTATMDGKEQAALPNS